MAFDAPLGAPPFLVLEAHTAEFAKQMGWRTEAANRLARWWRRLRSATPAAAARWQSLFDQGMALSMPILLSSPPEEPWRACQTRGHLAARNLMKFVCTT